MQEGIQSDPPRRTRIRGRKRRAALALVLAATALALAARWLEERRQVRAAHPIVAGEMAVVGLRDAALIIRDRNGVPHIRTRSERDAWLGLGFVHAQDRLAQLVCPAVYRFCPVHSWTIQRNCLSR